MAKPTKFTEGEVPSTENRSEGARSAQTSNKKTRNGKGRNKGGNKSSQGPSSVSSTASFPTPELAEQATQLSFNTIAGYSTALETVPSNIVRIDTVMNPGCTYHVTHQHLTHQQNIDGEETMPALLLAGAVTPGKAGVNLMASKVYTTLSSFTGRTASYACQDVAQMILAIAGVAEQVETIRRAFGLALTFNYRNRSMPMGLIHSMGINPQDLADHLSAYRMRFNVAIARINQIPLLENIEFIRRSKEEYKNIYIDHNSAMAQMFYYMPQYYFWLDEVGNDNGSILKAEPFSNATNTADDTMDTWLSHLEKSITALLESSTLNFIYADLLNMANKLGVKTWQFEFLAENYTVFPLFSPIALHQFHNLTIVGNPKTLSSGVVTATGTGSTEIKVTSGANVYCDADKNNILYNPLFEGYDECLCIPKWIIDMPTDAPTVLDRIEAMRYLSLDSGYWFTSTNVSELSGNYKVFSALADHYVVRLTMYGVITEDTPAYRQGQRIDGSGNLNQASMPKMIPYSQVDHAPLFLLGETVGAVTNYIIFGDLDFYTEIDYNYLRRVNDLKTVGLFDFRV